MQLVTGRHPAEQSSSCGSILSPKTISPITCLGFETLRQLAAVMT